MINGYIKFNLIKDKNQKTRCFGFLYLFGKDNYYLSLELDLYLSGHKLQLIEAIEEEYLPFKDDVLQRKLFVIGINSSMTRESIIVSLEKYGKVQSFSIIKERKSKDCRGFGFAVYEDQSSADFVALKVKTLKIEGKTIICKYAKAKNISNSIYLTQNQNNNKLASQNKSSKQETPKSSTIIPTPSCFNYYLNNTSSLEEVSLNKITQDNQKVVYNAYFQGIRDYYNYFLQSKSEQILDFISRPYTLV